MEGILLFLVGFTLLFFIYLYLHSRLSALIEKRLHELYRKDLQKDIADFYREMESYAALIEGKINRYKNLVERHEALLRKWENLSSELKKNKKTREISEVIEKSLEKEEKILELLEKNLSEIKKPPKVEKNLQEKAVPKEPLANEPNFALEILEEEKSQINKKKVDVKPNLEFHVSSQEKDIANKNWQNFFRQIGRLILPQEKTQTDFATLINLPPKTTEKPPEPKVSHSEKSLAVKKIDPAELSQLAEKMQKDPASRPAILRILLQHNIPLTMISHLTGIELSQLEAIKQLYRL